MGEPQRELNSAMTAPIDVRHEDSNTPAYHLQVRSFCDLYWKLHTLNKGLFSMEQMSIVLMLSHLKITGFSSGSWCFFFPLLPGTYYHHHSHASGSFLWVQIEDQAPGKINERQGLCCWYTLLSDWQSAASAPPPGSQVNCVFYNKTAQRAGHVPERVGRVTKAIPALSSGQPVSSRGIVVSKFSSQKYEDFGPQYLIIFFCSQFSVLELKIFTSSIFEVCDSFIS